MGDGRAGRELKQEFLSPHRLTSMPFVSKSQAAACYAKNDPNWDCSEWAAKTDFSKLPKRKRKRKVQLHAQSKAAALVTGGWPTTAMSSGPLRLSFPYRLGARAAMPQANPFQRLLQGSQRVRADAGGLGYLQQKVQAQQAAPLAKVASNWFDLRTYLRTPYRAAKSKLKSWFGGSAAKEPVGEAARAMQRNYGVTPETAQQVLRGTGMPESHAAYIPKGLAGEAKDGTKVWNPKMKHLTDPAAEAAAVRSQFPEQLPPEVGPHAQFGESLGRGMEALKQQRVKSLADARPTLAGEAAGAVAGAVIADKTLGERMEEEYGPFARLGTGVAGLLGGGIAGRWLHHQMNTRRVNHLMRPGAPRQDLLEAYRYAKPEHTPDAVLRRQRVNPRSAWRPSAYESVEDTITGAAAGLGPAYAWSAYTGNELDPWTAALAMGGGGLAVPAIRRGLAWTGHKMWQPSFGKTLAFEGIVAAPGVYKEFATKDRADVAVAHFPHARRLAGMALADIAASPHPELQALVRNAYAGRHLTELATRLASGATPEFEAVQELANKYGVRSPEAQEWLARSVRRLRENARALGDQQFLSAQDEETRKFLEQEMQSRGVDPEQYRFGLAKLVAHPDEQLSELPPDEVFQLAQDLGVPFQQGESADAVLPRIQAYARKVKPQVLKGELKAVVEMANRRTEGLPPHRRQLTSDLMAEGTGLGSEETAQRIMANAFIAAAGVMDDQLQLLQQHGVGADDGYEALNFIRSASPEQLSALDQGQTPQGAQLSPGAVRAIEIIRQLHGSVSEYAKEFKRLEVENVSTRVALQYRLPEDEAVRLGKMAGSIISGEGGLGQLSSMFDPLANTLLGWFLPEEMLGGMETWQKWSIILGTLLGAGGLLSGTDTGTVLGAIGLLGLLAGLVPSLFGGTANDEPQQQPEPAAPELPAPKVGPTAAQPFAGMHDAYPLM